MSLSNSYFLSSNKGAVLIMRLFLRGRVVGLSSLALLCLAGCSQDNESFVKAQASSTSGGPAPAAVGTPPKDQREYFKQQQSQVAPSPNSMPSGYPGAKK
jgi:hypothetical protein